MIVLKITKADIKQLKQTGWLVNWVKHAREVCLFFCFLRYPTITPCVPKVGDQETARIILL